MLFSNLKGPISNNNNGSALFLEIFFFMHKPCSYVVVPTIFYQAELKSAGLSLPWVFYFVNLDSQK